MKTSMHLLALVAITSFVVGCGSSEDKKSEVKEKATSQPSNADPSANSMMSGGSPFGKSAESVDGAENFEKLSMSVDGDGSDWQDIAPLWEEAGAAGPGRRPGTIDLQQVYFNNDDQFLYVFMRTTPTVQERFKAKSSSGNLCELFVDSDNDESTGCSDVSGFDYGKINGYEFKLWVPLGVRAGPDGTKPFISYDVQPVDEKKQFGFEKVASSNSLEPNALTAHGEDGVELAIPLSALGVKSGAKLRLLLQESADPFAKERYSEGSYTLK